MQDSDLPPVFSWYSLAVPRACPPKSLFIVSLLAAMWPATLFWFLGYYSLLQGITAGGLILLACMVFDLVSTYPRYKHWRSEWLCGECGSVFTEPVPAARRNTLQLI